MYLILVVMDLLCLQGAHISSFDSSNAYFCISEHWVLVFRCKSKFYALKHVFLFYCLISNAKKNLHLSILICNITKCLAMGNNKV